MFFPTQRNLPRIGDAVVIRPYSPTYTILSIRKENGYLWATLDGYPDEVLIEFLNWAPAPGCTVEVLLKEYLQWLDGVALEYTRKAAIATGQERDQHHRTVERIRKRQQQGIQYRTGELLQIDGEWCKVQFSDAAEVLPLHCVTVLSKD